MRSKFKTKVRIYTFIILLIASLSTVSYLSFNKSHDSTKVDLYFGKNAELIIERLKMTKWGSSSRGKKILSSFYVDEIRIVLPRKINISGKKYYAYHSEKLEGPSSGLMEIYKGNFTIYIGLYHISELPDKDCKLIRYMDYAIPEDEFIHILIDELVSRYWMGKYFIDGEASWEEEVDAWTAAEEAVQAYYDDPHYAVDGHSYSYPSYGPHSSEYQHID